MDILRAILLSLESMIEDPELQVNGFILIIDWSNFTFKQASKLTPSMLRLAIEGLQVRRWVGSDSDSRAAVCIPKHENDLFDPEPELFLNPVRKALVSFCFTLYNHIECPNMLVANYSYFLNIFDTRAKS